MIAKNMAVTRINLLHKIWCNIQKNDHMMATIDYRVHAHRWQYFSCETVARFVKSRQLTNTPSFHETGSPDSDN
jgi:hypothetical protein